MGAFDGSSTTRGAMGGKPCIRGTRVTVSAIAGLARAGHSVEATWAACFATGG